jgi:hypothetical protein
MLLLRRQTAASARGTEAAQGIAGEHEQLVPRLAGGAG